MVQDPTTLTTGAANGYVGGQIFYDAFMVMDRTQNTQ
jgi:hypothetical protein